MHTVARCSGAIKAAFLEQPTLSEFFGQNAQAEEKKKERESLTFQVIQVSICAGTQSRRRLKVV